MALTIAAGATALVAFLASPASAYVPTFCGGGRGPTEALAISSAVDDATMAARDMGFFGTCTFAEPPFSEFVANDPLRGSFWRGSALLHCAQ
jgi:hypothetical protein